MFFARTLVLACFLLGMSWPTVSSASSSAFINTGSMTSPHSGHTATLLSNGKVLVCGGSSKTYTYSSSSELYDPLLGTWTATGAMITPRSSHTATLLPNGKVLVTGGQNSQTNRLSSVEIYDPAVTV